MKPHSCRSPLCSRLAALGLALVGAAACLVAVPVIEAGDKPIIVTDARCDPDESNANACNYFGSYSCEASPPATYYCQSYYAPGECTQPHPGEDCRLWQNQSCGQKMSCETRQPAGGDCTGAPDRCLPG
jgi:hypothetical protein